MSPAKKDANQLSIGGEPRIDFLPLEIKQRKQNRRARRSLVFLVIAIVGVCIVGYVASAGLAVSGQAELDAARARTAQLLAEQGKYVEAQSVATDRDSAISAAKVGSANEILWQNYMDELIDALPAGSEITELSIDSLSSMGISVDSTIPLEKPSIATISFSLTTTSIGRASEIVERLKVLPGYADATITTITDELDEPMTTSVILHVNSEALERRLLTPLEEGETTTDDATEDQG